MKHENNNNNKNLFERYDIDPLKGPRAITERMRELAEDAADEAERQAIRAAWEELTLHPARRLRAAFGAHPESRPEIGAPPPSPKAVSEDQGLTLSDLAPRPSVARALGAGERGQAGWGQAVPGAVLPPRITLRSLTRLLASPGFFNNSFNNSFNDPLNSDFDNDPILKKSP